MIKYVSGTMPSEGRGPALCYLSHNTSIAAVPASSADADFVFNEITSNFQAITIEGQFTRRISPPTTAPAPINYAIDPRSRMYLSDGPERLPRRIRNRSLEADLADRKVRLVMP